MAAKIANLDDYLSTLDEVRAGTIRAIIDSIRAEFPAATVKIAWNVPQIQIDGEYVFGLSAAKNWLMLASWNPDSLPSFADRLAGYELNKRTFRVPVDWTPDRELLRDLIQDRLDQLASEQRG
ncbi:MAG: iron chaperone [Agromyces sp.]